MRRLTEQPNHRNKPALSGFIPRAITTAIYTRTFLLIFVLLFFGLPKPAAAEDDGCNRETINTPYYKHCNSDSGFCSAAATLSGSSNEEKVWNFFAGKGLTPVAIAGIMGNFQQEDYTFDPAEKQDGTRIAIPDGGDNNTGFGIAQWTTAARQAALFTEIRKANLQQYYGAGWGSPEVDKDIPPADTDKLLTIELNFAWDGDTTKIKDLADQLNGATAVTGSDGSAELFNKLYERSGDNASQVQERVKSASDLLKKYGDVSGSGSCSTGQLGGVATVNDAIPWAMKFVSDTTAKYHPGGHDINKVKKDDGIELHFTNDGAVGGNGGCWGALYCGQCTALSGWFVTNETKYTYGNGAGGEVVGNLKARGVPTGDQPKPFSVFSYSSSTSNGHTGVVLGVQGDGTVITIENNLTEPNVLSVRVYNIKEKHPDAMFAYVGDKLNVQGLTPGQ